MQISKSNEISQIDLDFFLSSSCFIDYLQRVRKHGGKILSINLFNIKRTQNTFHSAVAEIALQFKSGEIQVRNVFLRGKSVVIIPYFLSKASISLLLVRQNRISLGGTSLEFPAGGIEPQESSENAAKREIFEETGIKIDSKKLLLLETDFLVCESAFTESVSWYSYELSEKEAHKSSATRSLYGVDQEILQTYLISYEQAKKIKTFQIHCGLSLLFNALPKIKNFQKDI